MLFEGVVLKFHLGFKDLLLGRGLVLGIILFLWKNFAEIIISQCREYFSIAVTVGQTLLQMLYIGYFIEFSQQSLKARINIILILQMRKWRNNG